MEEASSFYLVLSNVEKQAQPFNSHSEQARESQNAMKNELVVSKSANLAFAF